MTTRHPVLRLGQVKGFADVANVPLAPITLIFGWNSAGKSTILQSLLLLKQTLEEGDQLRPSLVVNGSLTQLGSFRNLVHRHDIEATVQLGIEAGDDPWARVSQVPSRLIPAGMSLNFRQADTESTVTGGHWNLRFGDTACHVPFSLVTSALDVDERRARPRITLTSDKTTRRQLIHFVRYIRDFGKDDPAWRQFSRTASRVFLAPTRATAPKLEQLSDTAIAEAVMSLKFSGLQAGRRMDRMGAAGGLGFAPEMLDDARSAETGSSSSRVDLERRLVEQVLTSAISRADSTGRQLTSRVVYLGPFRQPPERLVLLTGEQFADVGSAGQNTIALLARSEPLREEVDRWLSRLNVPYQLAVDPLETTREMLGDVLVAGLRERDTKTAVGMRDVGFGISQVLPVIVQAVGGRGTLLAVEQPELHVHPRLQAELGDLFVEQAKRGSRFLLETHSEHLILRLLALVRKGEFDPDDLAVLYVDHDDNNNSVIQRLRIDEDAEFLDRWPHGFFIERRAELDL
jgi:predicted ATPase